MIDATDDVRADDVSSDLVVVAALDRGLESRRELDNGVRQRPG